MSIRQVRTVQAHPVPSSVQYASGLRLEVQETSYIPGRIPPAPEEEFPPGATCLNNMQGVDLYRCSVCHELVAESEFEAHHC